MSSTIASLSGKEVCQLEGLKAEDTVADVKSRIASLTGWSSQSLRLGINKRFTKDDVPISTYGWKSGIRITVVVSGTAQGIVPSSLTQEPKAEYGYLQIDNYAKKHMQKTTTGVQPGPKRWVALPSGVRVESYPPSCSNTTIDVQSDKLMAQPLRSCLQHRHHHRKDAGEVCDTPRSTLSNSTSASSSANRRVHFCNGLLPGSESHDCLNTRHDWIYIDRDICGFSLYEYAPDVPSHKDFASSQFAREFLMELECLASCNQLEQLLVATETDLARYCQEEKDLDQELRRAGVNEIYLCAAN